MRLYSLAAPQNPVNLADVCLRGQALVAHFWQGRLYVSTIHEDGIGIYDVEDPVAPVETAFHPVPLIHGFAVSAGHVFAASGTGTVVVIDVADPSRPVETATVATGADPAHCVAANGLVYVSVQNLGLVILDPADPTDPRVVGGIDDPEITYFDANGALGLLGRRGLRLDVVDLSAPAKPIVVGTLVSATPQIVIQILLRDRLAYIAGEGFWKGLSVVDVSDPSNPAVRGRFVAGAAGGTVALLGDTAYMSGWSEGTHIVDVADPDNLSAVSRRDTPAVYSDVALHGDLAAVANDGDGLRVLRGVAGPGFTEVGTTQVSGAYTGIAVKDGHALVSADLEGLRIYQLNELAAPVEVATVETAGLATRVLVAGNLALVADGSAGLHLADVTDVKAPRDLGAVDTPGDAVDVAVVGNRAFVADRDGGVRIVDVSGTPVEVGNIPTEAPAEGIASVAGDLLVAEGQCLRRYSPSGTLQAAHCDPQGRYRRIAVSGDVAVATDRARSVVELFDLRCGISRFGQALLPGAPGGVAVAPDGSLWVAADDAGLMVLRVGMLPPMVAGVVPQWGPVSGGSAVTIVGTCFRPGATASFGGIAASGVTVVSATAIAATTPAHAAGPVDVVVTNPGLPPATRVNGFTYGATGFFSLPPCRVVDTRAAAGALGGPALVASADRTFTVRDVCGIPATAGAISVNVTVTRGTAAGDLRLRPGGTPLPPASSINYGAGQTRANNATVPLGPGGTVTVSNAQTSGTVHFVLDVNGYYQ